MDAAWVSQIPAALLVGYVLPSVLMALPVPEAIDFDRKQIFIAAWQIFPVFVGAAAFILSTLAGSTGVAGPSVEATRKTYKRLLLLAGAIHFGVIVVAAAPGIWTLLTGLPVQGPIDFKLMFIPTSSIDPPMVSTMWEGTLVLLQWDVYVSSAAALLWISYLSESFVTAFGLGLARSLVVGPWGAVLWAVWDRDEVALQASTGRKTR